MTYIKTLNQVPPYPLPRQKARHRALHPCEVHGNLAGMGCCGLNMGVPVQWPGSSLSSAWLLLGPSGELWECPSCPTSHQIGPLSSQYHGTPPRGNTAAALPHHWAFWLPQRSLVVAAMSRESLQAWRCNFFRCRIRATQLHNAHSVNSAACQLCDLVQINLASLSPDLLYCPIMRSHYRRDSQDLTLILPPLYTHLSRHC